MASSTRSLSSRCSSSLIPFIHHHPAYGEMLKGTVLRSSLGKPLTHNFQSIVRYDDDNTTRGQKMWRVLYVGSCHEASAMYPEHDWVRGACLVLGAKYYTWHTFYITSAVFDVDEHLWVRLGGVVFAAYSITRRLISRQTRNLFCTQIT